MNIDYNTQLEPISIKEYGRNVQRMVEHCMTIEDADTRKLAAESVIQVMVNINPELKKNSDYLHKCWDHLYIMSGLKLEVESPYPKPTEEELHKRPDLPSYNTGRIRHRHYGKNIGKMIEIATLEEDPEKKSKMTDFTAAYMKMAYKTWNEDKVADEVIKANLKELSKGKLTIDTVVDLSSSLSDHPNNGVPAVRKRPAKKKKRKTRR